MDEKREQQKRKKAIRLWLKGISPGRILKIVQRGHTWLSKWKERYQRLGWKGLRSQSRRPRHSSQAYSNAVRWRIECAYRRVQKRRWGLRGMSAVRHELRVTYHLRRVPSISTIKRVLRQRGVIKKHKPARRKAFYPKPLPRPTYIIHAIDWTERFLYGGAKVYAFHTLNLETRAGAQTIAADKTTPTVITHLKKVWKTRGIPQGLQMDNDAAFYGSRRVAHRLGRVARLCLYFGIEPIFIPVGEAKRNGDVEQMHGVWDKIVWKEVDFDTLKAAQDFTPQFEHYYLQDYEPPMLKGQTAHQMERKHASHRFRLTEKLWRTIPDPLPITAGRVHFTRSGRVSDTGTIEVLNEEWPISKRLAGEYVWATLWTHRRRLEVFHRRSETNRLTRIKTFKYSWDEPVEPLRPEFKRSTYRRRMFTMS